MGENFNKEFSDFEKENSESNERVQKSKANYISFIRRNSDEIKNTAGKVTFKRIPFFKRWYRNFQRKFKYFFWRIIQRIFKFK